MAGGELGIDRALGWVLPSVPYSISRAGMLIGLRPGCAPSGWNGFTVLFRSQDDYVVAIWLAIRYLSFEFSANASPASERIDDRHIAVTCNDSVGSMRRLEIHTAPRALVTTLQHCAYA